MWGIASSTAMVALSFTTIGTIFVATIGSLVAGIVALAGLGFAMRQLEHHITGPSFSSNGGMSWDDIRSEYPPEARARMIAKIKELGDKDHF